MQSQSRTVAELMNQNRLLRVADMTPPPGHPQSPGGTKPVQNLRLTVIRDGNKAESFDLTQKEISVGRKPDNLFVLPDKCVSGHHALVRRLSTGDYEVTDLGSYNGTIINGQRIRSTILRAGDHILFGTTEAVLELATDRREQTDELAKVFESYQRECALLEQKRDTLSREAELNRSRVDHLKMERVRVLKECDQLQQRLEADRAELTHVQKELVRTSDQLDNTLEELRNADDERIALKRFEADRSRLDEELKAKEEELNRILKAIDSAKEEQDAVQEANQAVLEKQRELDAIVFKIEEAKQERDRLKSESDECRAVMDGFDSKEAERKEELKLMDGKRLRKEAELEFYETRIEQARAEREQLLEESREVRDVMTGFAQRKALMEEEERQLQARLEALRERVEQAEASEPETTFIGARPVRPNPVPTPSVEDEIDPMERTEPIPAMDPESDLPDAEIDVPAQKELALPIPVTSEEQKEESKAEDVKKEIAEIGSPKLEAPKPIAPKRLPIRDKGARA